MSFGVGIGDILMVAQLAKTTVANCRSAPNDFAEASRVSQSLYLMLDGVRTEYANNDSPLHRDERTRTDFAIHFKNCEHAMKPMAAYITKFASLNGPQVKLIDRFRISKRELLELRGNLAFYTARMSDFLQVIGLGTVGRVEKKVDGVRDYLPQMMAKIDQICAEVRIMGEKESLLSEHPDDEKSVWKAFRTRLISAGFTSRHLREHEPSLFLRIRELTRCGLLESNVSSKASVDLEDSELPVPVFEFPWQEPGLSHKCLGDETDAESTSTITPKPSNTSLRTKRSTISMESYNNGQKSGSNAQAPLTGSSAVFRVWRDREGVAIAKAKFLEIKAGYIILQDTDMQEIQVSKNSLSPGDLAGIASLQNSSDKPVGDVITNTQQISKFSAEPLMNVDAISVLSDIETIEIPRTTRPEVLVGQRSYVKPKWRYRLQTSLPTPPKSGRIFGKDTNDTLPSAAARGSLAEVKSLLKLGYSIEATGPESWSETVSSGDHSHTVRHSFPETTALYRSAEAGHFDVALYLLEQGANVNTRDGWDGSTGDLLLFTVIHNGDEKMTRLLLEYGAKKALTSGGKFTKTSLHVACSHPNRSIVRLLLDYNANIDAADLQGETPLYVAAMRGYASIVKLLLQEGAVYDTAINDGQSPLYKAAGRGHLDVVRYLLRYGADASVGRGRHGESTMYKAAWNNDIEIVELLLRHGADCNLLNESKMASYRGLSEQVLHGVAAGMGKAHALMNHWGRTALHAASYLGHEDLVTILIDAGAQLDIAGNDGQTPMYLAAHEHHRGVVQILLNAGAQMQTERHDPVLALLGDQPHEPKPSKAVAKRFNDPQTLARIGTTDVLVGFVAKMTENLAKRRR